MARVWAVWAVIGRHKQAEMEFRCRNDVDLEPKEPKISNQCGLSQSDTIRASDIWRGRQPGLAQYRLDKTQNPAAGLALKAEINFQVHSFVSDKSQAFRIIFRI